MQLRDFAELARKSNFRFSFEVEDEECPSSQKARIRPSNVQPVQSKLRGDLTCLEEFR